MTIPDDKRSTLFTVMCWLTILGNLLLIAVNLLKVGLLDTGMRNGGVGTEGYFYLSLLLRIVLLTCLGAIIGASFMLKGKLLGYRIYVFSLGLHALMVVCAMLLWAMTIYLIGISVLLGCYLIIPLLFLSFFRKHRKHLT